jgi:hypothetical protein
MIPSVLLILVAVVYRVVTGLAIHSGTTWLSNFAPLAAIALCGAAYFPSKLKFAVPLGALFLSDVILNISYDAALFGPLMISRYFALALVCWFSLSIVNRPSAKTLLPASIAASTFFYLVTNVFAWLSDPGYTKNFAGLVQSLTTGLPQYGATPTWMFFRNSLLSDLIFTGLFVLCIRLGKAPERLRATSPALHSA